MATLTEIAKALKDTFEGYSVPELTEELKHFKEKNNLRDAESIRIGDMNYIVINEEYKQKEYASVPDNISSLFFNSINISYAIIDEKTSSTLIDEVYSRVAYMQRIYGSKGVTTSEEEVKENLHDLFGEEMQSSTVVFEEKTTAEEDYADLFQLRLVLDSGTSAATDSYSFMWKGGEIKEIPEQVMRRLRRFGEISMLKDKDLLEENKDSIQTAVYNKFSSTDLDIQNVTVKSIFEIKIPTQKMRYYLKDQFNRRGVFNATYLLSGKNEFKELNRSIHTCNLCGHDLVNVENLAERNPLHLNIDVYDNSDGNRETNDYALGCEDCLERCPDCGSWHFNYSKNLSKAGFYDKFHIARNRGFIKGLTSVEGNYCSCRECIDWVYDERSGVGEEHNIIPISKLVFINHANEQVASFQEYKTVLKKALRRKAMDGKAQHEQAKKAFAEFRMELAKRYDMDVNDIIVTSVDKCRKCYVCGGLYYRGVEAGDDYNYRCPVCEELVADKRRMVTRSDGVVFMRRWSKKGMKDIIIDKYVVTKLGNLKRISSNISVAAEAEAEEQDEDIDEFEFEEEENQKEEA